MDNQSYKTAIKRYKLSAPIKKLIELNLIERPVLDFGCGIGFDADTLGFDKYDPHFFPSKPRKKYKTIICSYVLNVLSLEDQATVLYNISKYMAKGSAAYITVRRDIKIEGVTKIGTYQRNVILDLGTTYKSGSFEIYKLEK